LRRMVFLLSMLLMLGSWRNTGVSGAG
jgi:hypothetical protein